ncbi:Cna B-type domain-containing protein [Aristaeella lactis]|uniref:Cna B-type domain-containing protein n=1 Tax=Aristaeella lactis TaxID=3046383 RepID=UPI001BB732F4|nr:Cna B-type domain-containing protein [Aristaeella lactis]QUA53194.1 Cna B-type domain-containing protein [Aristaeella lactis]
MNSDEANEQLSDSITIAEGTGTVAFVNTYTKKTVDITVDKIWSLAEANSAVVCDATNVTWPAGTTVSVKLQKKVGDGEVKDVEGDDATATLSAAHPSHTFEDLVEYEGDQKVTYSVKEVAIEEVHMRRTSTWAARRNRMTAATGSRTVRRKPA